MPNPYPIDNLQRRIDILFDRIETTVLGGRSPTRSPSDLRLHNTQSDPRNNDSSPIRSPSDPRVHNNSSDRPVNRTAAEDLSNCGETVEELEMEIERLREELAAMTVDRDIQLASLEACRPSGRTKNKRIEELEKLQKPESWKDERIVELEKSLAECQAQLMACKDNCLAKDRNYGNLQEEYDDAQLAIYRHLATIAELREQIIQLQAQENVRAEQAFEMQASIDDLTGQIQQAILDGDVLRERDVEVQRDREWLVRPAIFRDIIQERLELANSQIAVLTVERDIAINDNANDRSDREKKLQEDLDGRDDEIADFSRQAQEALRELHQLREEINSVANLDREDPTRTELRRRRFAEMVQALTTARAERDDAEKELKEMQRKEEACQEARAELEERRRVLQERTDVVLVGLSRSRGELSIRLTAAESELEGLSEQLDSLRAERDAALGELEAFRQADPNAPRDREQVLRGQVLELIRARRVLQADFETRTSALRRILRETEADVREREIELHEVEEQRNDLQDYLNDLRQGGVDEPYPRERIDADGGRDVARVELRIAELPENRAEGGGAEGIRDIDEVIRDRDDAIQDRDAALEARDNAKQDREDDRRANERAENVLRASIALLNERILELQAELEYARARANSSESSGGTGGSEPSGSEANKNGESEGNNDEVVTRDQNRSSLEYSSRSSLSGNPNTPPSAGSNGPEPDLLDKSSDDVVVYTPPENSSRRSGDLSQTPAPSPTAGSVVSDVRTGTPNSGRFTPPRNNRRSRLQDEEEEDGDDLPSIRSPKKRRRAF